MQNNNQNKRLQKNKKKHILELGGDTMFEWIKGNAHSLNVTLYPTNITLNSSASSYFQEVRWVMVGINGSDNQVAVRPVTKREIDLKIVSMEHLHKISIGKGYARISSKAIMEEIAQMLNRKIEALKVSAYFDEVNNILIINLNDLL